MKLTRITRVMLLATTALLVLAVGTVDAGQTYKGKPPTNPTATPTPGGGGCTNNGGGVIYYRDTGGTAHALDPDCGTDASYRPTKRRAAAEQCPPRRQPLVPGRREAHQSALLPGWWPRVRVGGV